MIATKCICGKGIFYCQGGIDECAQVSPALIVEDEKPKRLKPTPLMYSCIFPSLQKIASEHGYNLLLHGSMNRDLDLVAIPWIDEPKEHLEMLIEMEKYVSGIYHEKAEDYLYTILPGGRHSYVINLNRGGRYNNYFDEQYYLDISITPLVKQNK